MVKTSAAIFAVLLGCALPTGSVPAQETAKPQPTSTDEAPLEVALTPYLWALAMHGNATVAGNKADVDVGFSDIVQKLNGAVMLDGEVRKGDFGVLFDGFYADLTDNGASGDDRIRIDGEAKQAVVNLAGTYRAGRWTLADWQETGPLTVTVDPYAGARFTYLDTELTGKLDLPTLGQQGKRSVDKDKVWIDPIIGVRTTWDLGDRWQLVLAGDAGGISTNSQYSAEGFALAGYRFSLFGKNNARFLAGYRAMHQKYKDGSGDSEFEWDITMHGPIMGLSVAF